uniref:Uncharacterized protein n=1 Tax=Anguilla anguilla TaxID=7936 RepID=A0A0E9RKF6_ANGAN
MTLRKALLIFRFIPDRQKSGSLISVIPYGLFNAMITLLPVIRLRGIVS